MSTRTGRTLTLSALTAAALISTLGVAPAQADDHPPSLTFSAQRADGGAVVDYSGRYAVWNDGEQAYVVSDDEVSVDQYVPGYENPWDAVDGINTNHDGTFSGSFKVYPQTTFRASVSHYSSATGDITTIAASPSATVSYFGPMPVDLSPITRYQKNAKSPAYIQADVFPQCIEEIDAAPDALGTFCPPQEKVILQSKIKGKWKSIGVFKVPTPVGNSYTDVIKITKPKGKQYRLYLPGSSAYQKSYSASFKTTSRRSEN